AFSMSRCMMAAEYAWPEPDAPAVDARAAPRVGSPGGRRSARPGATPPAWCQFDRRDDVSADCEPPRDHGRARSHAAARAPGPRRRRCTFADRPDARSPLDARGGLARGAPLDGDLGLPA